MVIFWWAQASFRAEIVSWVKYEGLGFTAWCIEQSGLGTNGCRSSVNTNMFNNDGYVAVQNSVSCGT